MTTTDQLAAASDVMAWWEAHRKIRRGSAKRMRSRLRAEDEFGEKYIDGFLHGIHLWLVLVDEGREFNDGWNAGRIWRSNQKRPRRWY